MLDIVECLVFNDVMISFSTLPSLNTKILSLNSSPATSPSPKNTFVSTSTSSFFTSGSCFMVGLLTLSKTDFFLAVPLSPGNQVLLLGAILVLIDLVCLIPNGGGDCASQLSLLSSLSSNSFSTFTVSIFSMVG